MIKRPDTKAQRIKRHKRVRSKVSGTAAAPVRQKVEIFPFSDKDTADTIAIGYNRERYLSKIARDFIDLSLRLYQKAPLFSAHEDFPVGAIL